MLHEFWGCSSTVPRLGKHRTCQSARKHRTCQSARNSLGGSWIRSSSAGGRQRRPLFCAPLAYNSLRARSREWQSFEPSFFLTACHRKFLSFLTHRSVLICRSQHIDQHGADWIVCDDRKLSVLWTSEMNHQLIIDRTS